MNDAVSHLSRRSQVSGLKRDSKLSTSMNEAGHPNQLVKLAIEEPHFCPNIFNLITQGTLCFLNFRDGRCKGVVSARHRKLDAKRRGFFRGKITDMLPSSSRGFVKFQGFKGGGRDDRHTRGNAVFLIERDTEVSKYGG